MSAELVYNVKFNIDPAEKKKISDIGSTAPVKLTIDDTEFEKHFQELRGDLRAKVFLEADATQLKTTIDSVDIGAKSVIITPFLDTEELYSLSEKVDKYFSSVAIKFSQESISNLQVQLAPLFASRIIDVGFSIQEENLDSLSEKISLISSKVSGLQSLINETDISTSTAVKLSIDDTKFKQQFEKLRAKLQANVTLKADASDIQAKIDALKVYNKTVLIEPVILSSALHDQFDEMQRYSDLKGISIKINQDSITDMQVRLAPLFASRIIDIGFSIQDANLDSLSRKIDSIESNIRVLEGLIGEVRTAGSTAEYSIGAFSETINQIDVNVLNKINELGLSLFTIGEGFGSFSTNLGIISSSLSEFSTNIVEHRLLIEMLANTSTDLDEAIVGAAKGFNKFKEAVSNFRSLNNVNKKLRESIKLLKEFSDITSVSVSSEAVDDLTRNYKEVSSALEKATNELEDYKRKVDELSQSASKQVSDNQQVEQSIENVSRSNKQAASETEELSLKFKEVSREEMNALMESARMQEKAARNRDKFSNSTEQLTDKQDQLRNVFFQEEQELKTLTAVTSNYDAEIRKMVTSGVKDVNVLQDKIDRLNETKKLLEDQIALVTGLANATELSSKEQEGANKALAQGQRTSRASTSTTKAYENSMHMLIDTQGDLTRQAGLANKQFSAINQSIFSFGDLIQDASQFQFGFAQGMRAVGNNIAFTAELFAVSQANIERHNKAVADGTLKGAEQITMFQAFKNQLAGPTGVVLAVNVAVTAIGFLSKALSNSSKSAEQAESAIDSFASASAGLRGIGAEDFLGIDSLERQSDVLEQSIKSVEGLDDAFSSYQNTLRVASTISTAGIGAAPSIQSIERQADAINAVDAQIEALRNRYGVFLDENDKLLVSQEDLEEKLKDVRAEIALNRAFLELDPLAKFRNSVSSTAAELQVLNDSGKDVDNSVRIQLESLKQQRDELLNAGESSEFFYAKLNILNNSIDTYENILKDSTEETKDFSEEIRKAASDLAALQMQLLFGADVADPTILITQYEERMRELREKQFGATKEQFDQLENLVMIEGQKYALNAQLLAQDIVGAFAPEGIQDQIAVLQASVQNARVGLEMLISRLAIDDPARQGIENLISDLNGYEQAQKKIIKNQEIVNNLMSAQELVNAGSVFAEMFGASKEFQIALATTSGLLAVVQTLADPNNPTFLGKLAASATIAATVAKQIQAIKDTEIGSAKDVEAPSAGSFGEGSSITEAPRPVQNISFAPTSQSDGAVIVVNNEVVASASELAVLTRVGERDIANSQKTVR